MTATGIEMKEAVLGLGSNLPSAFGDSHDALLEASRLIFDMDDVAVVAGSPVYRSKAWPIGSDQPDYANSALLVETSLTAVRLLEVMQAVEQAMGRVRDERWGARIIDIDILAYGECILPNVALWHRVDQSRDPSYFLEGVTVPHPRLHKRAFAIVPFADVCPNWIHPVLGKTALDIASALPDEEKRGLKSYK